MQFYKNYIFDLYGTLIDIYTDENDPKLWTVLAGFYSRYGADYDPDELKSVYHRIVSEELSINCRKLNVHHSDIKLENVFLRILDEAKDKHKTEQDFSSDNEKRAWTKAVSGLFRELSMRRFGVFPGVHETLNKLRERGAHLYLLSNAQRIFTIPEIEKAGLVDFFEKIYISSDYGTAKPEPAFMEALLSDQGLKPSECVMVGNDRYSDIKVAESCGIQGILLNTDGRTDKEIDDLLRTGDFIVIRSGRIEELL